MTTRTKNDSVVATYESHTAAESAIKALQHGGFDLKQLSIIAKDFQTEEHAVGFYSAGDRMKVWGGQGVFWGSLWGLLFGSGLFLLPAIGPIVVMGPLVGWIVGALEGAALGGAAGVFGAALTSLGVPKESVVKYEVAVGAGKFLVLANGSADMIERARSLLGATSPSQLAVHSGQSANDARQPANSDAARASYVTRATVLELLSDDEVARVSTAEASARLAEGEEYVDLEQLDRGVRRAHGASAPMGRVVPRASVSPSTWTKIVTQLESARA